MGVVRVIVSSRVSSRLTALFSSRVEGLGLVWVGWSGWLSLASVGLEEREVLEGEKLELERGPSDQLSLVCRHARLGHRLRHDRLR